jgi:hypothetical protein
MIMIASLMESPLSNDWSIGVMEWWSDGNSLPSFHSYTLLQYSNAPFPLYFRDNYGLGLADRFTGPASQAVLRPVRIGLDRKIEDIDRAIDDAFFASVAFLRIDVDQVDFVIDKFLPHENGPACLRPIELHSLGRDP